MQKQLRLPTSQGSQPSNVTLKYALHLVFSVSHNITSQTPQTVGNLPKTGKIYRRMPEEYLD
jgi:hypothetical protein